MKRLLLILISTYVTSQAMERNPQVSELEQHASQEINQQKKYKEQLLSYLGARVIQNKIPLLISGGLLISHHALSTLLCSLSSNEACICTLDKALLGVVIGIDVMVLYDWLDIASLKRLIDKMFESYE